MESYGSGDYNLEAFWSRTGVVKLALSDPQGVSEAFQGVYDR